VAGPLRISIHPFDLDLLLREDVRSMVSYPWRFVSEAAVFDGEAAMFVGKAARFVGESDGLATGGGEESP
jgi:hypothetical protein